MSYFTIMMRTHDECTCRSAEISYAIRNIVTCLLYVRFRTNFRKRNIVFFVSSMIIDLPYTKAIMTIVQRFISRNFYVREFTSCINYEENIRIQGREKSRIHNFFENISTNLKYIFLKFCTQKLHNRGCKRYETMRLPLRGRLFV